MADTVNFFEIGTPDAGSTRDFYSTLFGWTFATPNDAGYGFVDDRAGALWDTSDIGGQTWAVFYIEVADIRATLELAVQRGATTALPLVDNGTILFAHVADPSGNRVGIWQRKTTNQAIPTTPGTAAARRQ